MHHLWPRQPNRGIESGLQVGGRGHRYRQTLDVVERGTSVVQGDEGDLMVDVEFVQEVIEVQYVSVPEG